MRALAVIGTVLECFDEKGRPQWSEGFVVENGCITYVGPYARERAGPGAEVLELDDEVVLPGFIDAHAHLAGLGLALNSLDLRRVSSIKELKKLVAAKARKLGPGAWIVGRGWDQERFEEGRWPTRWDLDEAAPSNPVLLVRVCGHAAVANSLALSLAGVTAATPDPPGGVIAREGGKLTGVLKESAIELVRKALGRTASPKLVLDAAKRMVEQGITCVHAMSVDRAELESLRTLEARGALPLKVRAYLNPGVAEPRKGGVRLEVAGVKLILDGSFGARTAALRQPYSDAPEVSGRLLVAKEEVVEVIRKSSKAGLQVAIHAIGDRALETLLKAVDEAGESRVRVEHASLAPPDLLEELERLGLAVSAQPRFVISDWWIVDRLGPGRSRWVYPFKSFLKRGLVLAFSSDAPVEPCNPWEGVYAAVTRGAYEGLPIAGLTTGERLTVAEAVRCYTEGGAAVAGERLGTLKPGYPGDFVVVDGKPFTASERELKGVKVVATYVDGVRVSSGSPPTPHRSA